MKYRTMIMVPPIEEMPTLDLIKDLTDNRVDQAITLCIHFKELTNITPMGFIIFAFDDNDITQSAHTYYFNGTVYTRENAPLHWPADVWDEHSAYIILPNGVGQPFDEKVSTNLKINI